MDKTLGQFIRERRMDLGLTQEQLAERVGEGVRQAEISRLEQDRVSLPRRQRLEAIATALGVSIGDLLVTTGWIDAEHVPTVAPDHGMPQAHLQVLEEAASALSNAKGIVAHTAKILQEAERRVAAALETQPAAFTPVNGRADCGATDGPVGFTMDASPQNR